MARKIVSVPPLCKITTDTLGTAYGIERDGQSPGIQIWWDRSATQELLFVRQEAEGMNAADVVALTLSQLYAAIDALNRAVESK